MVMLLAQRRLERKRLGNILLILNGQLMCCPLVLFGQQKVLKN
jgi:hypothetical protein